MTDAENQLAVLPAMYAGKWELEPRQDYNPEIERWQNTLVEALISQSSLADRWDVITAALKKIGLDQVNYGLFSTLADDQEVAAVRFLSTMDTDWLNYYQSRRLDQYDVHAELVRSAIPAPYLWGESAADILDSSARRRTQGLTIEAGLRASLHVPLPNPLDTSRCAGGFTLGSSVSELEFQKVMVGYRQPLLAIAHLFHSLSVGEWRQQELAADLLSVRERECLTWLAAGLRVADVGDRLGIARGTVELHLRSARQKLGAATMPQAVARALLTQQIKLG